MPARRARPAAAPTVLLIGETGPPDERLRDLLAAAGMAVTCVSADALPAVPPADRPDLLVLAASAPRDGQAAVQEGVRAAPGLGGVPLLVVARDCGIDAFGGAIGRGASAFLRAASPAEEIAETALRLARFRRRPRPADARGTLRRPLLLPVDLDLGEGGWRRARIVDVSATGCRLEVPCALEGGSTIGIVPRSCDDSTEIRLAGVVRWSREGRGGHVAAVRWTATAALVARRLLGLG